MVEILMGEARRYTLGGWLRQDGLRQDASVASAEGGGRVVEAKGEHLNAGTRTDMVRSERSMAKASLGGRWGSQVPYTVGTMVETN